MTRVKRMRRFRKSRRGAALVEAAVVIPVMLVFLGCIMFAHRSYDAKLDKQMGTRAGSLYWASHSCEGDTPDGVVPLVEENADPGDTTPPPNTPNVNRLGNQNSAAMRAGLERSYNLVRAKPADSYVYGSAVEDRRRVPLNRKISAASEVGCNEKAYTNPWLGLIGVAASIAQGGGFKD